MYYMYVPWVSAILAGYAARNDCSWYPVSINCFRKHEAHDSTTVASICIIMNAIDTSVYRFITMIAN